MSLILPEGMKLMWIKRQGRRGCAASLEGYSVTTYSRKFLPILTMRSELLIF